GFRGRRRAASQPCRRRACRPCPPIAMAAMLGGRSDRLQDVDQIGPDAGRIQVMVLDVVGRKPSMVPGLRRPIYDGKEQQVQSRNKIVTPARIGKADPSRAPIAVSTTVSLRHGPGLARPMTTEVARLIAALRRRNRPAALAGALGAELGLAAVGANARGL